MKAERRIPYATVGAKNVGGTTISFSFGSLLTLVFVMAKLWDKIDWSWWWVCSPLWLPAVAVLAGFAVFFIVVGVLWCVASVIEVLARALRGRRDNNL